MPPTPSMAGGMDTSGSQDPEESAEMKRHRENIRREAKRLQKLKTGPAPKKKKPKAIKKFKDEYRLSRFHRDTTNVEPGKKRWPYKKNTFNGVPLEKIWFSRKKHENLFRFKNVRIDPDVLFASLQAGKELDFSYNGCYMCLRGVDTGAVDKNPCFTGRKHTRERHLCPCFNLSYKFGEKAKLVFFNHAVPVLLFSDVSVDPDFYTDGLGPLSKEWCKDFMYKYRLDKNYMDELRQRLKRTNFDFWCNKMSSSAGARAKYPYPYAPAYENYVGDMSVVKVKCYEE